MFQFPGFLSHNLLVQLWMTHSFLCAGFPHSDICGSLLPYSSPQRFAVWCVLLQLQVARHSPYALICLICFFFFSTLNLFNFARVFFQLFGKTLLLLCLSVIQFSKTSEKPCRPLKTKQETFFLHSFSLERR